MDHNAGLQNKFSIKYCFGIRNVDSSIPKFKKKYHDIGVTSKSCVFIVKYKTNQLC